MERDYRETRTLTKGNRVLAAHNAAVLRAKKRTWHKWWKLTSGPLGQRKVIPVFRLMPVELYAMQAAWREFWSTCESLEPKEEL